MARHAGSWSRPPAVRVAGRHAGGAWHGGRALRQWQRDGRPGFFHPDAFSFGNPLWLSAVQGAALTVEGVRSVEALAFERWGRQPAGELAAGVLEVAEGEILRCDTDPNRPENGGIEFQFPGAAA